MIITLLVAADLRGLNIHPPESPGPGSVQGDSPPTSGTFPDLPEELLRTTSFSDSGHASKRSSVSEISVDRERLNTLIRKICAVTNTPEPTEEISVSYDDRGKIQLSDPRIQEMLGDHISLLKKVDSQKSVLSAWAEEAETPKVRKVTRTKTVSDLYMQARLQEKASRQPLRAIQTSASPRHGDLFVLEDLDTGNSGAFLDPATSRRLLSYRPLKAPDRTAGLSISEEMSKELSEIRTKEQEKLIESSKKDAAKKFLKLINEPCKRSGVEHFLGRAVNISQNAPFLYKNQGKIGCCTAESLLYILSYYKAIHKDEGYFEEFSPLWNYYYSRYLLGLDKQKEQPEEIVPDQTLIDSGAPLTYAIQSVQKYGLVPERLWPFDGDWTKPHYRYAPFQTNPLEAKPGLFEQATSHFLYQQNISHVLIPHDLMEIKKQLSKGNPLYVGIWCTAGFMSRQTRQTGVMPLPQSGESVDGGHAMALVGYDDDFHSLVNPSYRDGYFIFKNSWGEEWGRRGLVYIPYSYIADPRYGADIIKIKLLDIDVRSKYAKQDD